MGLFESKSSVPPPLLPVAKPDTSSSSTNDKNSPAPVTQKVTYVSPLDSYVVDGYILVPKATKNNITRCLTYSATLRKRLVTIMCQNQAGAMGDLNEILTLSDLVLPDHVGWLIDQSNCQRKWCVIADMLFCIFSTDRTDNPERVLILPGYEVKAIHFNSAMQDVKSSQGESSRLNLSTTTISGMCKFQFTIENLSAKTELVFGCESQESVDEWVSVLKLAASLDTEIFDIVDEQSGDCHVTDHHGNRNNDETLVINTSYKPSTPRNAETRLDMNMNRANSQNSKLRSTKSVPNIQPSSSRFQEESASSTGSESSHEGTPVRKIGSLDRLSLQNEGREENSPTFRPRTHSADESNANGNEKRTRQSPGRSRSITVRRSNSFDSGRPTLGKKIVRKASTIRDRVFGTSKFSKEKLRTLQPIQLAGYLYYKSLLKWSKYWCVVCKGRFYAFKSQSANESPELAVPIVQYTISVVDSEKRLCVFKLCHDTNRNLYLAASDNFELERWLQVLRTEANVGLKKNVGAVQFLNKEGSTCVSRGSLNVEKSSQNINLESSPRQPTILIRNASGSLQPDERHSLDRDSPGKEKGKLSPARGNVPRRHTTTSIIANVAVHPKNGSVSSESSGGSMKSESRSTSPHLPCARKTIAQLRSEFLSPETDSDYPESSADDELEHGSITSSVSGSTASKLTASPINGPKLVAPPIKESNIGQESKTSPDTDSRQGQRSGLSNTGHSLDLPGTSNERAETEKVNWSVGPLENKPCNSNLLAPLHNRLSQSHSTGDIPSLLAKQQKLQDIGLLETRSERPWVLSPIPASHDLKDAKKVGYLDRCENNVKWTRQWCVLRSTSLYCYQSPDESVAMDTLRLPGYILVREETLFKGRVDILKLISRDFQPIYFCCESVDDAREWHGKLQRATEKVSLDSLSLEEGRTWEFQQPDRDNSERQKEAANQKWQKELVQMKRQQLLDELLKQKEELEHRQALKIMGVKAIPDEQGQGKVNDDVTQKEESQKEAVRDITLLQQRRISTQLKMDLLQRHLLNQGPSPESKKHVLGSLKKKRISTISPPEHNLIQSQLTELTDSLEAINREEQKAKERFMHNLPLGSQAATRGSLKSMTSGSEVRERSGGKRRPRPLSVAGGGSMNLRDSLAFDIEFIKKENLTVKQPKRSKSVHEIKGDRLGISQLTATQQRRNRRSRTSNSDSSEPQSSPGERSPMRPRSQSQITAPTFDISPSVLAEIEAFEELTRELLKPKSMTQAIQI